jgi:hypothetical protein
LHELASSHEVPVGKGAWETPVTGSQESLVQGLPSVVGTGLPTQVPEVHWSFAVQALPSEHEVPFAAGVWTGPLDGLHESAVQGLPSSTMTGVPGVHAPAALQVSAPLQTLGSAQDVPACTGAWATPVCGLQESVVQGLLSVVETAVPAQAPEVHWSFVVQALASEQTVPSATGVCCGPVVGLQESAVQGLPSSTLTGMPGVHAPAPSQAALLEHWVTAAHAAPIGALACNTPSIGSHESAVHGLPSLIAGGVPDVQTPVPLQISLPLHNVASPQDVPAEARTWATPPMGSHESTVHGFASSRGSTLPGVHAAASQVVAP